MKGGNFTVRTPIIVVLGHVDAGKTRFLDYIRGTSVIDREAGGITQHIGATEVPIHVVQKISGELLKKYGFDLSIPGLLFIDTPGHEVFTTLRERGSSIADLCVVVIDINKGCQEQTLEALNILRNFKVPFIVAANKTDAIFEWESEKISVTESFAKQSPSGIAKMDKLVYHILGQLHEKGFQSERFDRVSDFTKQVPIIPVSAKTGEGFPEVLMFLAGLSQKYLEKKLTFKVEGPGKGTILEVREEKGLGKTVDVILYDGTLKVGDKIALGGKNGVIETKVRALLKPMPLDEMRDPAKKFTNVKEVIAASGIKIVSPGLGEALAGSPLIVVESQEDVQRLEKEIKSIKIEADVNGPIIRADTLGGLEAIIQMLQKQGLKIRKADIGEITRKDLMEIESVAQTDKLKGVIFSFNTKTSPEILKDAEARKIKIFHNNIIYHLIEEYTAWVEEQKEAEKKKKFQSIIYPCELQLIPGNVFRNSKPAIVGVQVLRGKLRSGITLMKKDGKIVGEMQAMQLNGKSVDEGKKGDELAISIPDATVGRTIEENEILYSSIPKQQYPEINSLIEEFSWEEKELIEDIKNISEKNKKKEEDKK
ncbi:MAG: translation initiation factor IF-2 [Candidatus Diapherotrites archaeon]|nr:translation initiation factor IF-2 [Candidatus Diapherotrites archaeon]